MAINRTNQPVYLRQAYGPGAYAVSGGTVSSFTSTGANPRDAINATYRVHTFTQTGTTTMTFEKGGFIDVLLVAGGGSGGNAYNTGFGGGGGGGGVLETYNYGIDAGTYSITVPVGGIVNVSSPNNTSTLQGGNAVFHSLVAFGGGCGGQGNYSQAGMNGGCGGGSNGYYSAYGTFGNGSGITNQGFSGGNSTHSGGIAGGGGGAGGPAPTTSNAGMRGDGGIGRFVAFDSNVAQYYAGGGQGGNYQSYTNGGGLGGGGNATGTSLADGGNASFYGGGGAGGTSNTTAYRSGGSGFQGLVIIRYRIS